MSGKLEYTKLDGEVAELLKKYFVTSFRPGYVSCKNVILPEYYQLFGDRIREMDIRDDDIWVCSFPKAGEFPILNALTFKILLPVILMKIKVFQRVVF